MSKKPRVDYPAIYFKINKDLIFINAPMFNCFKKDYKFAEIMYNNDNKTIKITFKTNYEPGYAKLRFGGINKTNVWLGNKSINDKIKSWFADPSLIKEIHLAQQDVFDNESWYVVFSSKPIKIDYLMNMSFDIYVNSNLNCSTNKLGIISFSFIPSNQRSPCIQVRLTNFFRMIIEKNDYNEATFDYDSDLKKIIINFKPNLGLIDIKKYSANINLMGITKSIIRKILLHYFNESELFFDNKIYYFKLISHPTREHVYYLEKISELCKIGISDCDENINVKENEYV